MEGAKGNWRPLSVAPDSEISFSCTAFCVFIFLRNAKNKKNCKSNFPKFRKNWSCSLESPQSGSLWFVSRKHEMRFTRENTKKNSEVKSRHLNVKYGSRHKKLISLCAPWSPLSFSSDWEPSLSFCFRVFFACFCAKIRLEKRKSNVSRRNGIYTENTKEVDYRVT